MSLTDEDILAIYRSGERSAVLAERYNISTSKVSEIWRRGQKRYLRLLQSEPRREFRRKKLNGIQNAHW